MECRSDPVIPKVVGGVLVEWLQGPAPAVEEFVIGCIRPQVNRANRNAPRAMRRNCPGAGGRYIGGGVVPSENDRGQTLQMLF